MRKYYFRYNMWYCYPCETSKRVEDYGVLSQYVGKLYNRDEIDEIICELITRHPYIEGSMKLEISVMWIDRCKGFYHSFDFINFDYKKQKCGDTAIKFEK